MLEIDLKVDGETFHAGDEIILQINLSNTEKLKILDGSVQLIGKSMFVSNFYSFPRVKELFGEMSKVKEESKVILTEKGESFTFPFYLTRPSLLIFDDSEKKLEWRGKVPIKIPPSFIGLFYSFQNFIKVKIIWKNELTHEIGSTEKEISFKVINNNFEKDQNVLGMLSDVKIVQKDKCIDEIFPDDLIIENSAILIKEIERIKSYESYESNGSIECEEKDKDEYVRSLIECDKGYHRSISVTSPSNSTIDNTIALVHLRKCLIQPGTQIFITIDLNSDKIDWISLKLDCIEIYPFDLLKIENKENVLWRESVKELKIIPGNRDKIEIVFPVSPELPSSFWSKFINLKWELLVKFLIGKEDFNLTIPLKFVSIKLDLNKKTI